MAGNTKELRIRIKSVTSTLQLTTFEDTLVEGTINCNRDGLLYTSIPQNGNWVAYVDGEPAEIRLVGDAMVSVELMEAIRWNSGTRIRHLNWGGRSAWQRWRCL